MCVTRAPLTICTDQNDAQSWYLLGRCYMSQQKYPKAYEAYQQAVYRDGRNPTFWCSIGVLYYQINQYRDALDAYSRAIRLNPNISEVWYDLGTLVRLRLRLALCNVAVRLPVSSMNPATIKPTMPWMHINEPPTLIPRTSISKHACSSYKTGNLPAACPIKTALHCHKIFTLKRTSPPPSTARLVHNGVRRHHHKHIKDLHHQPLITTVASQRFSIPRHLLSSCILLVLILCGTGLALRGHLLLNAQ
jgi:tetratricopeptide (TPR) repeat protein